jgi:hypothetical protein
MTVSFRDRRAHFARELSLKMRWYKLRIVIGVVFQVSFYSLRPLLFFIGHSFMRNPRAEFAKVFWDFFEQAENTAKMRSNIPSPRRAAGRKSSDP